ncbi:UNVERIFIED_CONTAM: hypothetical protein K2H54_045251 [Gekko kuhli]
MAGNYIDALDPEKLMQCPYDKNHQIRACRFPYHLVKCRKNHPDIVQQLVTCPFNARHQVPRTEISQHISSCDDKRFIEQDIGMSYQLGSLNGSFIPYVDWLYPTMSMVFGCAKMRKSLGAHESWSAVPTDGGETSASNPES